jgi:predicted acyltransferase
MNAIAVFVASGLLAKLMGILRVGSDGISLKGWLYEGLFASWAGPLNGSLAFALAYVLFWLGLMWILYRRGIFIKI